MGGVVFGVKANTTQAVNAFSTLGKAAKNLENRLRQTKTLFGGLSKNLRGAASAVGGFVAAIGTARIASFTKNATLLAARVQNLGTVLNNVGRIAGLNSAQIRGVENSVKSLGITTRAARQSLTQLIQANIDSAKAAKLTRIAQDAAVIAGIDSSEAFNRLVVSVQRNDVRLLRNLGIVINLNQVYTKFSQTTGRTAASLTAFEKRQLVLNEVLKRGDQITGTYEASLGDAFKQFTSLRRKTEEAVKTFGEQFIPVFEKAVTVTSKWLDAFVKGQTAIGPKFLATVAAATLALGAFATVVGGVAAALIALQLAAAGPAAIAIMILGLAITGGVAAWVNYKVSVLAAEQRLKAVEEQAEETAQALFEGSKIIQQLADIGRPFGGATEEQLAQLKVAASELSVLFPELAKEIEKAASLDSPAALVRLFKKVMPEALESTEKQIEIFGKRRVNAEEKFRDTLLKTFQEQEGITEADRIRVDSAIFRLGNLAGATATVQEFNDKARTAQLRFNKEIANGSEEFIKLNPLLVENTEGLKKFGDTILAAERRIIQLRQAKLTETFQEFQQGFKELEQAGNQANQIIRKLQSQRDRAFKGTNLQLVRDFQAAQQQLVAAEFNTEKQILEFRAAFAESQNNEARQVRDDQTKNNERNKRANLITEKEFQEERIKILGQFAAITKRIEAQGRAFVETGLQSLKDSSNAAALTAENAVKQLEKQEAATERLLEIARLEAEGIGPRLLKIREKFITQSELLTKTNEELAKTLQISQDKILESTKLTLGGFQQVIDGAFNPKQLSPKARALVKEFQIIQRSIRANQNQLLALEKSGNQQFLRERKRLSDKLIKERENLNKELLNLSEEGQKKLSEATIEGLLRITKAFKNQAQERGIANFLRDAGAELVEIGEIDARVQNQILGRRFKSVKEFDRVLSRLRRNAVPGIKELRTEFDKFQRAASKATTAKGLAEIEKLFGQRLTSRIFQARSELKRFETQLREFREAGRPKQERDDRIENQRLFNELVDQGVPILQARQEIERRAVEQRKELNRQEDDLKLKVKEGLNAARKLQDQRLAIEAEFQLAVEKQTAEIERQLMLRERLVKLQGQEAVRINQQLAENKKSQASLGAVAGGGITGLDTPADGAPGAPAQEKTPLVKTTTALTKEAAALAAASKRQADALDAGLAQTQRSLRSTREASDRRLKILEDFITERLIRDAEAGKAKMRQAELIRKKT